MSEYQYYEFLAVDRLLTDREMDELRAISTRADITPTRFVNVYNWGDLKADPARLLERYFDVHVYVANWGSRRLMLRLPAALVDRAALQAYQAGHLLSITESGQKTKKANKKPGKHANEKPTAQAGAYLLIDMWADDEDLEEWEEGDGWMASLAPVREELLRGDLRPLYIAWLQGVDTGEVDEHLMEPPVPPGLRSMSTPQKQLASFLRIDPHLLAAAAKASTDQADARDGLADWITTLPAQDKDRLLLDMAEGRAAHARAWLLHHHRQAAARQHGTPATDERRRTAGALREASETIAHAAAQRAARARQRREAEAAAARVRYLEALAPRQDALWQDAERLVASRQQDAYDQAIVMLRDLYDLSVQRKDTDAFTARLNALRQRHRQKHSFLRRLPAGWLAG